MPKNFELAAQLGANVRILCKDGFLEITMTEAQLDAFAKNIKDVQIAALHQDANREYEELRNERDSYRGEAAIAGKGLAAMIAERDEALAKLAEAMHAVGDSVPVSVDFLRGFCTLAHNYSMKADAPEYYYGVERDAFSAAYARCGIDLSNLRAMLPTDRVV